MSGIRITKVTPIGDADPKLTLSLIGDIEVEAATARDAERLLEKARAIRAADAAEP